MCDIVSNVTPGAIWFLIKLIPSNILLCTSGSYFRHSILPRDTSPPNLTGARGKLSSVKVLGCSGKNFATPKFLYFHAHKVKQNNYKAT